MTVATYAIGIPGQAPRMILTAAENQVTINVQADEVYFSIYNYPAPPHKINDDGTALVSTVNLAFKRDQAWASAKMYRDQVVQSGCVTSFGPIDTDLNSRLNLQDAVRNPDSQFWVMQNSQRIDITLNILNELADSVSLFVQACYINSFNQKDAIYNSDTPEAIDLRLGYPTNACFQHT